MLPHDLHEQNRNGALFEKFLKENQLTCVNTLPLTEGLVTRKRKCLSEIKESTIDFYIVCERVLPFVTKMQIDDGKNHIVTNYGNVNSDGNSVNSDHYPLIMEVKLVARPIKKTKVEIFNFNEVNSQILFKDITSNTNKFTNCFTDMHNVSKEAEKWMHTLKTHLKRSFKKIRIREKYIKPSSADKFISERNKMVRQGRLNEARIMDAKIASIISQEGRTKAFMFNKYTDSSTSACLSEMWKMKKSTFPKKAPTLPSSKINYQGQLVSEPSELVKVLGEEYGRVRLGKRPTNPLNIGHKKNKEFTSSPKIEPCKRKK